MSARREAQTTREWTSEVGAIPSLIGMGHGPRGEVSVSCGPLEWLLNKPKAFTEQVEIQEVRFDSDSGLFKVEADTSNFDTFVGILRDYIAEDTPILTYSDGGFMMDTLSDDEQVEVLYEALEAIENDHPNSVKIHRLILPKQLTPMTEGDESEEGYKPKIVCEEVLFDMNSGRFIVKAEPEDFKQFCAFFKYKLDEQYKLLGYHDNATQHQIAIVLSADTLETDIPYDVMAVDDATQRRIFHDVLQRVKAVNPNLIITTLTI